MWGASKRASRESNGRAGLSSNDPRARSYQGAGSCPHPPLLLRGCQLRPLEGIEVRACLSQPWMGKDLTGSEFSGCHNRPESSITD